MQLHNQPHTACTLLLHTVSFSACFGYHLLCTLVAPPLRSLHTRHAWTVEQPPSTASRCYALSSDAAPAVAPHWKGPAVDWSRYHLQILFVDHSDQLRAKLAAAFFEQVRRAAPHVPMHPAHGPSTAAGYSMPACGRCRLALTPVGLSTCPPQRALAYGACGSPLAALLAVRQHASCMQRWMPLLTPPFTHTRTCRWLSGTAIPAACCPAPLVWRLSARGAAGTGPCRQASWRVPVCWACPPRCFAGSLNPLSCVTLMHMTWWSLWTARHVISY